MSYKYDYSELEQFLSEKRWVEADQVTASIICRMNLSAGEIAFLTEDFIKALPCENLNAIDSLWTHYSNGLFGFSVQAEIWKSLGSPRNSYSSVDCNAMDSFLDRVGWSSSKDTNKGYFPWIYAIRTKNNFGSLDRKTAPLGYIIVGISFLLATFIVPVIEIKVVYALVFIGVTSVICALIAQGFVALGFGSLIFYESKVWCMLLSRMTQCKRS